jgi:energy-coupling factor transporter ATP-binding protein EcfA2
VVAVRRPYGLTNDLTRLATALEGLALPGPGPLGEDAATVRDRLVSVIRSYLIPRVDNPGGPLLVVVAGPTGSGKSTLVNTLAGLDLSPTGPLRPTTTVPLVLTRAGRHEAGMTVAGVECEVRVGAAPILDQMSLIDTPDLDSTSADHRLIAEQLIDHADIVIFVTSALRYADDVPWEVLRRALSRGTTVIPVLNRVGAESAVAMAGFRALLGDAGIDETAVRVPEHHLGPDAHRIPSLAVGDLRRRLYLVAMERERFHREVVNRVINVTAAQVVELVEMVAGINRRIGEMSAAIESGVSAGASLEKLDLSSLEMPTTAERLHRRWKPRRRPSPEELSRWMGRVRASLIAGLETRVREVVAEEGNHLIGVGAATVSGVTRDSGALITTAVDGWLEHVDGLATSHRHRRLATMALVSAALTSVGEPLARAVLADDFGLAEQSRGVLESQVGMVFAHHGGRLVALLHLVVGEPDTGEVERRLSAVLAAYQFADA